MHTLTCQALVDPDPAAHAKLYDSLIDRFEHWVRQFQGYRKGEHDYMKNVIGFSRWLRGMLIAYELLRKDRALTDAQIGKLNAYIAISDRVYGQVPHRYNLHLCAKNMAIHDGQIFGEGDFDLDLVGLIQHPLPDSFEHEAGQLIPNYNPPNKPDEKLKHAQRFVRVYNRDDGIYRTLLFAKERDRDVTLERVGHHGMKVMTPQYTDYVFLHDQVMHEQFDDVAFVGRSAWVRQTREGVIHAAMIDGDELQAFGHRWCGAGPWTYDPGKAPAIELQGGPPRHVVMTDMRG